jgi:hypothetical protein
MRLASFKLRFHETHVRILPAEFDGPGVDVHGDGARACFELAKPMIEWLLQREPSVKLRAMSVDLETRRVLVSFEDAHAVATRKVAPIVLRVEPPESSELIDRAGPLIVRLEKLASDAIASRPR